MKQLFFRCQNLLREVFSHRWNAILVIASTMVITVWYGLISSNHYFLLTRFAGDFQYNLKFVFTAGHFVAAALVFSWWRLIEKRFLLMSFICALLMFLGTLLDGFSFYFEEASSLASEFSIFVMGFGASGVMILFFGVLVRLRSAAHYFVITISATMGSLLLLSVVTNFFNSFSTFVIAIVLPVLYSVLLLALSNTRIPGFFEQPPLFVPVDTHWHVPEILFLGGLVALQGIFRLSLENLSDSSSVLFESSVMNFLFNGVFATALGVLLCLIASVFFVFPALRLRFAFPFLVGVAFLFVIAAFAAQNTISDVKAENITVPAEEGLLLWSSDGFDGQIILKLFWGFSSGVSMFEQIMFLVAMMLCAKVLRRNNLQSVALAFGGSYVFQFLSTLFALYEVVLSLGALLFTCFVFIVLTNVLIVKDSRQTFGIFSDRIGQLAHRHQLSGREIEVLILLVQGKSREAISQELQVSSNTIKTHTSHVYAKLKVHSREELLELFK